MNIKRAKEEITRAVRAYLSRDELGQYRIPPIRQRPILLMGPPGVGKTQIMEQIAAETGIGLVAYTITHHTRQSALGLPFLDKRTFAGEEYTVTSYTMSEILAAVHEKMERTGVREGILFLDEINCISETLTPMLLQFLQCKTFGNQPLPSGWIIVAAGNPPEYNKSVREFDVVTLDRVKRIDVEADFGVWKEYARRRGLHGAIISYLELRHDHFYAVETTADGLQFVTARGWEDLSEMIYAYEALELPVDRELVGQYLQLPRIARDFANYYQLYQKYRTLYRVDEVLEGRWEAVRARELAAAPFDERLSVLGLLLAGLGEQARALWEQDGLTELVYADLTRVRGAMPAAAPADALRAALEDRQKALAACGASDRQARAKLLRTCAWEQETLDGLAAAGALTPEDAFDRLRERFAPLPEARGALADRLSGALEAAFAFLEAAVGEGQDMVLFATELTADYHLSWFIQNFGCEAYYRHNKALLFDDTQREILDEIAAARASDTGEANETE